jgi:hypothetical protein
LLGEEGEVKMLEKARYQLLFWRGMLYEARRAGLRSKHAEQEFLAALDRVWAVQCMLNPSLS